MEIPNRFPQRHLFVTFALHCAPDSMEANVNLRILAVSLLSLAVAACTGSTPGGGSQAQGTQPKATHTGAITVKGSDTMVILNQRLAERFMAENPGKTVQVTGGGSGTGIAALINGTTDIAQASRSMKDTEKAQVQQKRGAPAVEIPVALDGLAIFVNEKNPLPSITLAQLASIYMGETTNWKQLGGEDAPIVLYGRENNSGTYAYFKEHVLKDEDFAAETQTLPGTAAVVNAVSRDPRAIGYGGIAYAAGIRQVPVKKDADSTAVAATLENVSNGSYPISRFLFLYTAGQPTGDVKQYIDFALSPEGQKIAGEVGYYPLPR